MVANTSFTPKSSTSFFALSLKSWPSKINSSSSWPIFTTSAWRRPHSICSRASSIELHSGRRRLGSKVIMAPASFAMRTASLVVLLAGSPVMDRVPKWKTFVSVTRSFGSSSMVSIVSAPGFLANENSRSPLSSKVTKASVVKYLSSTKIPLVSTPASRKVLTSILPNRSLPTFPRKPVFAPNLERVLKKFPGAPPGFPCISGYPTSLFPWWTKSIRSSPKATTSYILIFYPFFLKIVTISIA